MVSRVAITMGSDLQDAPGGILRTRNMRLASDSHHYIVLSYLHAWLEEQALPQAKGILLDYGCGGQPYRALFEPNITKYIGADVAAAAGTKIDIRVEPEQPLPLSSESVDTILSTQTLEHVPDFNFYLAECQRLARPGGVLILTAPMQWRHHEAPHDYWRFTRYGIRECLSRHGFEVGSIMACGGVYALIGQIFLNHLVEHGIQRKIIIKAVNRLALRLDRMCQDQEDTLLWMCLAKKKSGLQVQPRWSGDSGRIS